jgi:hypothetical protein
MKKIIILVAVLVGAVALYHGAAALVGPPTSTYVGPPEVQNDSTSTTVVPTDDTAVTSKKDDTSAPLVVPPQKPVCPPVYQVPEDELNKCIANGGKMVYNIVAGCRVGAPVCTYTFQRPVELTISAAGTFLAHGMVVTSIDAANNTFTGEVWGTTWKVDVSTIIAFVLRTGNTASVSNVIGQLSVGEEVGVSGTVDKSNPGVVMAHVVRNYNSTGVYAPEEDQQESSDNKEQEQEQEQEHAKTETENKNQSQNLTGTVQTIQNKIQTILQQIEAIRAQLRTQ